MAAGTGESESAITAAAHGTAARVLRVLHHEISSPESHYRQCTNGNRSPRIRAAEKCNGDSAGTDKKNRERNIFESGFAFWIVCGHLRWPASMGCERCRHEQQQRRAASPKDFRPAAPATLGCRGAASESTHEMTKSVICEFAKGV